MILPPKDRSLLVTIPQHSPIPNEREDLAAALLYRDVTEAELAQGRPRKRRVSGIAPTEPLRTVPEDSMRAWQARGRKNG